MKSEVKNTLMSHDQGWMHSVLVSLLALVVTLVLAIPLTFASLRFETTTLTQPLQLESTNSRHALSSFGQHAYGFEANQGQFPDSVGFVARSRHYASWLTGQGITVSSRALLQQPISIAFKDAQILDLQGQIKLSGVVNYLRGKDESNWIRNVPLYEQVIASEVYSNIDIRYYGHNQLLEYDFIVRPEGNVADIILQIDAADALSINEHGDLVIAQGEERLLQHKPTLYQTINGERVDVQGHYRLLSNHEVGIEVIGYDQIAYSNH